jgi:hypothetical protein
MFALGGFAMKPVSNPNHTSESELTLQSIEERAKQYYVLTPESYFYRCSLNNPSNKEGKGIL